MPKSKLYVVFAAGLLAGSLMLGARPAGAQDPYAKYLYPLSPRPAATPKVVIDVSDDPEARPWAERAQALCAQWFPYVCQLLATDRFTPPRTLRLVFKKTLDAPAYTAGDAITIDGAWIKAHPDDFGMVIHEMTHVVQAYPDAGDKPGWLVEGIADYIRWWRYEPEAPRTPLDPAKASYKDSYRTTAAFLAWIVGKRDRRIIRVLDAALREGKYHDSLFAETTGKSVDALWAEFVATLRPQP